MSKEISPRDSKPAQPAKQVGEGSAKAAARVPSQANASFLHDGLTPTQTKAYRELFWQNFIREVLVSLIAAQTQIAQEASENPSKDQNGTGEAMSDGRMGIITEQGQRIPIARIFPVFAQSMEVCDEHAPREVELAQILQCTIFQVETPAGEVYTLPLHEIRAFHAFSEKLLEQLANKARKQRPRKSEPEQSEPFGFAAFTRTARSSEVPEVHTNPAGAD